jgi:hypothetical protein
MSEGFVPLCYVDEITPPPREHPNNWILKIGELFYLDTPDDFYTDKETGPDPLFDGRIYGFERLESFGDAVLTIKDDKSYALDKDMPAGAESVYAPCDTDTLSGSIEELIENCSDDLGPGDHSIEYFSWVSEQWRFDAATGVFAKVPVQ